MKKFSKINESSYFDDNINVNIDMFVDPRAANYVIEEIKKFGISDKVLKRYGYEKVVQKIVEATFREMVAYNSAGIYDYLYQYLGQGEFDKEDILDELGMNIKADNAFKKINDIND